MRIETWEQLKKHLNNLSDVEIKCCGRLSISKNTDEPTTTNQASVLIMEDGTLEIVENKIQWRPLTEEIIKERGFDFVDNSESVELPEINNECPSKVYEYMLEGKDAKSDRRK